MSTASEAKKVLTMKIVVDTKSGKLLYGEAGKDVVDFIINLLNPSLCTVTQLLETSNNDMVGCAANIYNSIRTVDPYYLPNDRDDNNRFLLQLDSLRTSSNSPISCLTLQPKAIPPASKYYQCQIRDFTIAPKTHTYSSSLLPTCRLRYISREYGSICPGCSQSMTRGLDFFNEDTIVDKKLWFEEGGPEEGMATYMVKDDLSITPLTSNATISILRKFNVVIGYVEERSVRIGCEEGLLLLKASLQSKTALTDVFMKKKNTVVSSTGPAKRELTSQTWLRT